ncbi:unnamed protein product, partial [Symbiodinium necroappetens]
AGRELLNVDTFNHLGDVRLALPWRVPAAVTANGEPMPEDPIEALGWVLPELHKRISQASLLPVKLVGEYFDKLREKLLVHHEELKKSALDIQKLQKEERSLDVETRAAAHLRLAIQRMNMYSEDAKIASGAVQKPAKAKKSEAGDVDWLWMLSILC